MKITDSFVQVSPDCPVERGIEPTTKKEGKTAHMIQYELLSQHPYMFTLEDLIYEVHIRHKQIPDTEVDARGEEIRAELFQKSHPCMRASMLPKKHGWGVHYNEEGKIALYAMESEEYQQFVEAGTNAGSPKLTYAMRSSRG
ncbi:hypothetical protein ICC18_23175 [Paenibacillus sp. WST5]|uniref:Uncharacterized protein n=2 Tax=Paenibacillus sedimenti TaxID=2770274 RepID=A0A926KT40_9BACL|nr:hypothetical protein [Paenibacillus sedimenti]